jgi:hypothetical protein
MIVRTATSVQIPMVFKPTILITRPFIYSFPAPQMELSPSLSSSGVPRLSAPGGGGAGGALGQHHVHFATDSQISGGSGDDTPPFRSSDSTGGWIHASMLSYNLLRLWNQWGWLGLHSDLGLCEHAMN